MTGRNPWPPKGTRPVRPEDDDLDTPIYLRVPDHIVAAQKSQQKHQETNRFRRWIKRLTRIFVRP
jgi:hypothetical protein